MKRSQAQAVIAEPVQGMKRSQARAVIAEPMQGMEKAGYVSGEAH